MYYYSNEFVVMTKNGEANTRFGGSWMMKQIDFYPYQRDAIDRMHNGWIRLPKDADGEYIHVGDVLTDGEYKFKVFELAAFGDGSWSIRDEDGDAWAACDVTHHHEPTVEDVLRDMHAKLDEVTALYVGEAIDSDERDSDEARIFAEYASKLRLAGDAE